MTLSKYHLSKRNTAHAIKHSGTIANKFKHSIKPTTLALAVAQAMVMQPSQAATITVQGNCGLSQAILSANNDTSFPDSSCEAGSGADTIELTHDVIITEGFESSLTGVPTIKSALTINGNGHTIKRDDNAPGVRILHIDTEQYVNINNTSIRNGLSTNFRGGAGILVSNVAGLELDSVTLTENTSVANGAAGAIAINTSNLISINNSIISGNEALSGGALRGNAVNVIIENSSISNNKAADTGGAIRVGHNSKLKLSNVTMENNSAGDGTVNNASQGGAIFAYIQNDISFDNVQLNNNQAGTGGAIWAYESNISINHSHISGNSSSRSIGDGGAIWFESTNTSLTLSNSTVSNNTSLNEGGAIYLIGSPESFYTGDAIANVMNSITNSTFSSNRSKNGGALAITSRTYRNQPNPYGVNLTIANSTFVSNTAIDGNGGAIYSDGFLSGGNASNKINLINNTLSNNTAYEGGGVFSKSSQLNALNNIIAGNIASSAYEFKTEQSLLHNNISNNVFGTFEIDTFQALNSFIPNSTNLMATNNGNYPTVLSGILQPLSNNGGSTLTQELVDGSPAVNMGDITTCLEAPINELDQRGVKRLQDNTCDIGALENTDPSVEPATSAVKLPELFVRDLIRSERNGKAIIRIGLSKPLTNSLTVDFRTSGDTAVAGQDYIERSGKIVFQPGETRKTRTVTLLNDKVADGDKTFFLVVSNPVSSNNVNIIKNTGAVNIIDDEGTIPFLVLSGGDTISAMEPSSSNKRAFVKITARLLQSSDVPVRVSYQTLSLTALDNKDFIPRSGEIYFEPGQTIANRYIEILHSDEIESNEKFIFELSNPRGIRLGDRLQTIEIID